MFHHVSASPVTRRAAAFAIGAALMLSLIAPATASATTVPISTIRTSVRYLHRAGSFTVTGRVIRSLWGKRITLEIRKPGRTFWSAISRPTNRINGYWACRYFPKLGGTFFLRARYSNRVSRTTYVYVSHGPGIKTQIDLASTTSTRDSGLFEALEPAFLAACPEYTVKAQWLGSGAAIKSGGDGNADVLLTHSPQAEIDFMNGIVAGVPSAHRGKTRYRVMYNDFVLVGPTANPASVDISSTGKAAFSAVASASATFWSRNDNSGTNTKEKEIWASLGNPQGTPGSYQPWYKCSGTMGMAEALSAANNASQLGYTLSDRATWLCCSKNLKIVPNLKVVNAGDPAYFNQYSVIEVSGARNWEGAQDFSRWIRCPSAQGIIRNFGKSTYGEALFIPNQGSY